MYLETRRIAVELKYLHVAGAGENTGDQSPAAVPWTLLDWNRQAGMDKASVIVSDPEILGGTPCFRGTRVPVDSLIDYLEAGDTLDEFLDNFPSVSREAAIAALEEAKTILTRVR